MSDFPSQKQDKFVLRLPDGMREQIKEKADRNNRSMNAEILDRLEKSMIDENEILARRLETTVIHAIFEVLEILSENGLKQRALSDEERQRLSVDAVNRLSKSKTG